jgi:dsDNA-specific endonuclease/ATPase MutS2
LAKARGKDTEESVDAVKDHATDTPVRNDQDKAEVDEFNPFPEPVVIEFRDVLDLHSIPPRLVKTVVEDYIDEAHRRGVRQVRIIHGKGIGVQREMVRSILGRSEFVAGFQDAPAEAGGWGATIARLR